MRSQLNRVHVLSHEALSLLLALHDTLVSRLRADLVASEAEADAAAGEALRAPNWRAVAALISISSIGTKRRLKDAQILRLALQQLWDINWLKNLLWYFMGPKEFCWVATLSDAVAVTKLAPKTPIHTSHPDDHDLKKIVWPFII